MHEIIINCSDLTRHQLHKVLAKELNFPEWYGNNLDALYDCLTSIRTDTCLTLQNLEYKGFRLTLEDAAQENPHLHITLE